MIDFENDKRLYFPIKEVADHFVVEVPTLRYWEKEFKEIKPHRSLKGTRQYTREDVQQISIIHRLLKEKGMTIEGAKQMLRTKIDEETKRQKVLQKLENIRKELINMQKELEG